MWEPHAALQPRRSGGLLSASAQAEVATWKDLMKVHSSVRMPSPRLSSLTRRMTRKRRKKVMEIREFSSAFWNPLATGGGN